MLNINIGDFVFSLKIFDPLLFDALKDRLSLFITHRRPDYNIGIKRVTHSYFKTKFPAIGNGTRPIIEKENINKFTALCNDAVISVDLDNKKALITTSCLNTESISTTLLNDTIAFMLMRHNAIMLHSSGILTQNGVFLFCGPSGSGKSTIALNSNGLSVLNDESIVLHSYKGKVSAFGTPWHGTAKKMANIKGTASAIFFIKISDKFECKSINKSMAYLMLLRGITIPFAHQEFLSNIQTDIALEIIQSIPCYKLNFLYSMPNFWEELSCPANYKELVTC